MDEDEREERTEHFPGPHDEHDVGHPRGTLLIMLGFLMMIIGFWLYVYVEMVERAGV